MEWTERKKNTHTLNSVVITQNNDDAKLVERVVKRMVHREYCYMSIAAAATPTATTTMTTTTLSGWATVAFVSYALWTVLLLRARLS